ncbi:MAG: MgtC/SapB family protein [Candidatus Promineifilaceae bacterium]|jgi:putative Mg2+ transporter-C (MgtC) family protein
MNEQLPGWISAMQSFGLESMLQVFVAAVLGGFIGLEREWRGRDAGLRTNMLISMGACLFTVISINGFPLQGSSAQDSARVAAGVVTGVGFLGAGAFIHTGSHTKGMTTAATVWMVAAIGMAVGVQAYGLAVFASVATFVTLRFLQPVSKTIAKIDSHKESLDD